MNDLVEKPLQSHLQDRCHGMQAPVILGEMRSLPIPFWLHDSSIAWQDSKPLKPQQIHSLTLLLTGMLSPVSLFRLNKAASGDSSGAEDY